jgi:para-aminobenzoate synthetase/4-amino-4-deoxychorismate lyase
LTWERSVSDNEYRACFSRIKSYIGEGDTYQVNYSFRLRAHFDGDPWALFVRMIRAQGDGYGAFVRTPEWAVCSASPELFFTRIGDVVVSRPMKGTMPRGMTLSEDRTRREALARSEKNRAENLMIVDMVRNDLGRIAESGSVQVTRLFDLEKYPTLWQMTSTVRCRTQRSIPDIFRHTFPAASITGAPKVRTMQIIREVEPLPRRIYTGSVGFIAPTGRTQFNVAIRTVLVDRSGKQAEYGVGGGLVWDSECADEGRECVTKARVLTQPAPAFALLETLLWTPGEGYALREAHVRRLADSAEYFSRELNLEAVCEKLDVVADGLSAAPHRVRVVVPLGGEPTVEAVPLRALPVPYRLVFASRPVDSRNPFLYHKTTCRDVYEQALKDCPGVHDVLLWNERGELTESCIANVVVRREDGRLVTPPVQCGLLAGTYRAQLLASGEVTEEIVRIDELKNFTGIYLVNSVRGMWVVDVDLCAARRAEGV